MTTIEKERSAVILVARDTLKMRGVYPLTSYQPFYFLLNDVLASSCSNLQDEVRIDFYSLFLHKKT